MNSLYFILGYVFAQSGDNCAHPANCECEVCVANAEFIESVVAFAFGDGLFILLGLLCVVMFFNIISLLLRSL